MGRDSKRDKLWKEVIEPNWPQVDISKQDANFFVAMKLLNNNGLDPKYDLEDEHVTTKERTALFGGKNFKVKSLALKLTDKVAMEEIYWKVFATYTITNNEMPTWIVCGFVAQKTVTLSLG
jgi:hypothetical protein